MVGLGDIMVGLVDIMEDITEVIMEDIINDK